MDETEKLAEKIKAQVVEPAKNWFLCSPEPEKNMRGSFWRYTPCEALRHAFQLMEEDPVKHSEEIKLMMRVASSMTKKLAKRLTLYEGRGWGRRLYEMTPWWRHDKPGCVLPGRRG